MVLYIRFDKCVVLLLWSRVRPGGVKFCRATMTTKVSWRRYGWSYTERSRCRITSRKPADVDTTTTSTTPFRTQEQWVPPASLSHYFDQSRTLATCASIRHDTIRDQKLAGYFKEPKQTRLATANGSRVSICHKNFGTLQGPALLDGGRDRPPTNTPLPYRLSCQMWYVVRGQTVWA